MADSANTGTNNNLPMSHLQVKRLLLKSIQIDRLFGRFVFRHKRWLLLFPLGPLVQVDRVCHLPRDTPPLGSPADWRLQNHGQVVALPDIPLGVYLVDFIALNVHKALTASAGLVRAVCPDNVCAIWILPSRDRDVVLEPWLAIVPPLNILAGKRRFRIALDKKVTREPELEQAAIARDKVDRDVLPILPAMQSVRDQIRMPKRWPDDQPNGRRVECRTYKRCDCPRVVQLPFIHSHP